MILAAVFFMSLALAMLVLVPTVIGAMFALIYMAAAILALATIRS